MGSIVSDIVQCENQIHRFFPNREIGSPSRVDNMGKEKGVVQVSVFHSNVTRKDPEGITISRQTAP